MANVTVTNSSNNPISGNIGSEESWIAFYISVAICALMGLVSVFGNGLVVYISNKKKDSGKFRFVNRVVKHLALSDFLYGVIGIPCTIIFWLWGQDGTLKGFATATPPEHWKTAIIRFFFFSFQCSSCYFVFLIVVLRLCIVINPMDFVALHKKITRVSCIVIWSFMIAINLLPIFCSAQAISGKYDADRKVSSYIAVLHIGITIPILLTSLVNAYLSFALGKLEANTRLSQNNFTERDKKKSAAFKKLINGLVVWLIICNTPYIAWYHYSLACYNSPLRQPWIGIEGLLFTVVARLLVLFNSCVNPMVYATTIPEFKRTLRRLINRSRGIVDESLDSTNMHSLRSRTTKNLQKSKSTDSILGPKKTLQKSKSSDSILG